jgi:hypothetical protein
MTIVKYKNKGGTRELGGYTWNEANDWTQDVTDQETLEQIMTYPYDQFEVVEKEGKHGVLKRSSDHGDAPKPKRSIDSDAADHADGDTRE